LRLVDVCRQPINQRYGYHRMYCLESPLAPVHQLGAVAYTEPAAASFLLCTNSAYGCSTADVSNDGVCVSVVLSGGSSSLRKSHLG
jgi:hypothetical protein